MTAPVRLILLGTKGGPSIRDTSQLPSANLLIVGEARYLVDAGYGVTYRLVEQGVDPATLRAVFITHHHSDHNLEFGTLLYNAWVNGRRAPFPVYAPNGGERLVRLFMEANAIDIDIRIADEGRPDPRALIQVQDYAEGLVADDGTVRVTALRNVHPPIESYALKFQTTCGRTVVFSGDTAFFPPLAQFARGADLLLHEVMHGPALDRLVQRNPSAATLLQHLRASHTLSEDVGRIAAEAGVRQLVLNHFVPGGDPSVTEEDWVRGVRAHYAGPVTVGRDGLEIPITPPGDR